METVKEGWHRRLPVRRAFFLSTLFCGLLIVLLSLLEAAFISAWRGQIARLHEESILLGDTVFYAITQLKTQPQGVDWFIYHHSGTLAAILILLTALVLITLNAYLLYHWKLKQPLEILEEASQRITQSDFSMEIPIPSDDELGRLCRSFEAMRRSLLHTNRELWQAVEERRRLNAAFAHDLRTPLTVLRGYNEMLLETLPSGKMDREAVLQTAQTIQAQVLRLDDYLTGMNAVKTLSDIRVRPTATDTAALESELKPMARVMWPCALEFNFSPTRPLVVDSQILVEVFQNLLANAARYARTRIAVTGEVVDGCFYLTVADDGPGFSPETLAHATEAYYRAKDSDPAHFGLGLYICRVLCEKCGGRVLLSSPPRGGAIVTAKFPAQDLR